MMKLKFNWGTGIALVYAVFIIVVLITVIVFMNQDVSLETKDYYVKGIKYQQEIDRLNRTKELPEQLELLIKPEFVQVSFPKIFRSKKISGSINLYRPSDKTKDFSIAISTDSLCNQFIPASRLVKGLWKVKIDWLADGISYYNEKSLMVD